MDFAIDPIIGAGYRAPKIGTAIVQRPKMEAPLQMHCPADLSLLVAEYEALVPSPPVAMNDQATINALADDLAREAEWTPDAAHALICLVKAYGSFMLRNATALAIALGVEGGELDF